MATGYLLILGISMQKVYILKIISNFFFQSGKMYTILGASVGFLYSHFPHLAPNVGLSPCLLGPPLPSCAPGFCPLMHSPSVVGDLTRAFNIEYAARVLLYSQWKIENIL